MSKFELGLYSFAENTPDPITNETISTHQRYKNLLETFVLADQVGLDVYGVGEHHRKDFQLSTPSVFLAAAASLTKNIRLASAVTVLSSDEPIRVFQQFATLDLVSDGRAEIMAGRGSFIESFPLFGYDLDEYQSLFTDKLQGLLKARASEKVDGINYDLSEIGIFPRPVQEELPIWVAVGGTPHSAIRAGTLGLPMAIAIIGGAWEAFAEFVDIYRQAGAKAGHLPSKLKVSINSHGYIGEDSKQAVDEFYPAYAAVMAKLGRERGWPPSSKLQYEHSRTPRGANFIGDPEEIAEKILAQHRVFRHDRCLLKLDLGTMPHAKTMKAIELFGTQVAPVVRKEIADRIFKSQN